MKNGLYANINAKQARIAAGSKEKMRKPGAAGKPVKQAVAIAYAVKRGAMMKKKAGRG